jgi:glycosyltransferase involved in cell wall biosynthesis
MPSDTQIQSSPLALVVVIPALNEQATVADTIRRIPTDMPGIGSVRVIVVNDGSTDATAAQASAAGAMVISHARCQGVGKAFQTGLAKALEIGADIVVNTDADGQFDPATIPALIAPVVADQADFATASRFADPKLVPDMPAMKKWGNRMMSRLISKMIGQTFHDVSCGMRCYNRQAANSLNLMGTFTYTQEVFLNLAYKQMRMVEVPIKVEGVRKHGKSRVANNLFRYALRTSAIIFSCYRDYKPMRFFGSLAAGLMVPAILLEGFVIVNYAMTGSISPHKWAAFTGAGLFGMGLFLLHMGIIGDMLNRHRVYLEELLQRARQGDSASRDNRGKL